MKLFLTYEEFKTMIHESISEDEFQNIIEYFEKNFIENTNTIDFNLTKDVILDKPIQKKLF